jgi:hypothetical protein
MAQADSLNDPQLRRRRDAGLRRLARLFAGAPGRRVFVLCGVRGTGRSDLYAAPEAWMAEALADLAGRAEALRDPVVFRPLSVNPWPYGVHFVDTFFGAAVYELDGEPDNWQARYVSQAVGTLAAPRLASHPSFRLAQRLTRAFLDSGATLPLFAPPVLSSPLNIALNLYGPEFLLALLGAPAAARRDLRVITGTIRRLHLWFQAHVPAAQLQMVETRGRIQPPGHGQLCGCSTHLLSAAQYAEFIAPLDAALLGLYPGGGMIHLCGAHAQHIPTWRAMPELSAVQLNDRAAADLALYAAGLRPDQVLYVNPCPAMPLERILEITGGRRTVVVDDIRDPLPLRRAGPVRCRRPRGPAGG